MGNDDQGMICVLLYKQTYIDDELLADFNKDKAEVEEKIKTDPNYQINKSSVYFKEKDVYYKIWQTNYCLFFRNNIYIEYGCYNDTGELPTPEHYDYKMVNGIIVEGTYYWPYEIEYKEHKYITSIGYDQNGNLTEISKSTTS